MKIETSSFQISAGQTKDERLAWPGEFDAGNGPAMTKRFASIGMRGL